MSVHSPHSPHSPHSESTWEREWDKRIEAWEREWEAQQRWQAWQREHYQQWERRIEEELLKAHGFRQRQQHQQLAGEEQLVAGEESAKVTEDENAFVFRPIKFMFKR